METATAYAELGLRPGASGREVKAAWRRLVSEWHPDRNPSARASERMQRINQAFAALQAVFEAPPTEDAAPPPPPPPPAPPPQAPPRGARSAPPAPPPAAAPARVVQRRLVLSLEEAAAGGPRPVRGRYTAQCLRCSGTGHGSTATPCRPCDGSGTVREAQWFGWVATRAACAACNGTGLAHETCPACSGAGRFADARYAATVAVPPGARNGDVLTVRTPASPPGAGDVEVQVRLSVRAHPFFTLDDADGAVRCTMPVDGFAWLASGWVDVPTLAGVHQMRLKRGHLDYRLKGQGFPQPGTGARGDLRITVEPLFPPQLGPDQQALLDQLAASSRRGDVAPHPRLQGWQQGLRESARARKARAR